MSSNIVTTFLELGDATSHNLKFSHCKNVFVSYGEETITESNLLEIRRRHPDRVYVKTFPKVQEAQSGADWEWHIVGRKLTLKMRVQAKRVQRDGKLKIKHKVKSSGREQHDLLLEGAKDDNMKPLYCIYCTEPQRLFWKQSHPMDDFEGYQTGCLLADANDVSATTTKLDKIEHKCIPWHYLFERANFAHWRHERIVLPSRAVSHVRDIVSLRVDDLDDFHTTRQNIKDLPSVGAELMFRYPIPINSFAGSTGLCRAKLRIYRRCCKRICLGIKAGCGWSVRSS